MITKERLEELIEQKTSIYWKFAKIKPSSWSKYTIIGNTIVKGNLKETYSLYDLFENKAEAEWHAEFGCIERTERLQLPTWEEMQVKIEGAVGFVEIVYNYRVILEIEISKIIKSRVYVSCKDDIGYTEVYKAELTKENYTLACRKCKELFLGE